MSAPTVRLDEGGVTARGKIIPLLWVIGVGCLVRVLMVMASPDHGRLKPLEPSVIAANLNAGRGLTFEQYGTVYRAWKEPLYIVLLAWLTRWAGNDPMAVLVFQGMFGVLAAVGVALIAWAVLGDATRATLAGVMAAANPFLVYYDTRWIHPLSMDACLFVAMIGTILIAARPGARGRQTLAAGLVMGLTLWQRAVFLASGAGSWLAAVVCTTRSRRRSVALAAAGWLGIAMLAISPWLVRNYTLFGRLILTTDAAHILWLGNNPWSNGTYSDMKGERVFFLADAAFRDRVMAAPELVQHDLFLGEVRRFIIEHPAQFGALALRRLVAFVWFSPNAGIRYTRGQNVIYRLAYLGLLSFGVSGLILSWRRMGPDERRALMVLIAAVAGLAVAHALSAINMKHRVPLELVLAIFASESLARGAAGVRG